MAARLPKMIDGPALTLDGRVLELDGGFASYFEHDKESSPSHAAKSQAKVDFQMNQAIHVAHGACEGEARIKAAEACCVDEAGVVHGDSVPASPNGKMTSAERLKLVHEKRRPSNQGSGKICVDSTGQVHPEVGTDTPQCVIDCDGVVRMDDASPPPSPESKSGNPDRLKQLHRKRVSRGRSGSEGQIGKLSVDDIGQVRLAGEAKDQQCVVDSDGVVHMDDAAWMVDLDGVVTSPPLSPESKCATPDNLKRFHRKRVSRGRSGTDEDLMISVDGYGVIRDCWMPDFTPLILPMAACAH